MVKLKKIELPQGKLKMIELTHLLTANVPTWNGSCGFCLEVKKDYDQDFRVQKIKMHAGVGTHMDAPSHRFQAGWSIADITLETLIVPVCLIDVRSKSHAEYVVSESDIEQYETTYGTIPNQTLVIIFTGWSRFWSDPKAYRNVDAGAQMRFPAVSSEAAKFLLKRNIVGLAIDTLSPDCLDLDFPVHQILLGNGKYIIENVSDCSEMPPSGGSCVVLPLYAQDATEAPVRMIGLAPC